LAGRRQPLNNERFCRHLADLGGDAFAHVGSHVRRAEHARQPIDGEFGKSGFRHRRNIGRHGRALARRDRDHPHLAALHLRPDDGDRRQHQFDAAFRQIIGRRHRVPVRHARDVEVGILQEAGEQEVEHAGDRRPIELAGFRARHRDQFGH